MVKYNRVVTIILRHNKIVAGDMTVDGESDLRQDFMSYSDNRNFASYKRNPDHINPYASFVLHDQESDKLISACINLEDVVGIFSEEKDDYNEEE